METISPSDRVRLRERAQLHLAYAHVRVDAIWPDYLSRWPKLGNCSSPPRQTGRGR